MKTRAPKNVEDRALPRAEPLWPLILRLSVSSLLVTAASCAMLLLTVASCGFEDCAVVPPEERGAGGGLPADAAFLRGDMDGSDSTDVTDAIAILDSLFVEGTPPLRCVDAADANDDGHADVSDAVYLVLYLFAGGAAPPPPFGACGPDPTEDALDCARFDGCPGSSRCLSEDDVRAIVENALPDEICAPVDTTLVAGGTLTLTICPGAAAGTCGGEAGCSTRLDAVDSVLDLARQELRVRVVGHAELPIAVEAAGLGSMCDTAIDFAVDFTVPLVVGQLPGEEGLTLFDILEPRLVASETSLAPPATLLCDAFAAFEAQFFAAFRRGLIADARTPIETLRSELAGTPICRE